MENVLLQQDVRFETDKIMAMTPEDFIAKLNDDPEGFTGLVIKLGIDRLLTQCLSAFLSANKKSGNVTLMAQRLIDNRRSHIIVDHLSDFIEAGATIDAWSLAEQCIANNHATRVVLNIESFAAAGANPSDIINLLLDNGKIQLVEKNIDILSEYMTKN